MLSSQLKFLFKKSAEHDASVGLEALRFSLQQAGSPLTNKDRKFPRRQTAHPLELVEAEDRVASGLLSIFLVRSRFNGTEASRREDSSEVLLVKE